MKLARIILPCMGNDYSDLFMVHQDLKHELIQTWGGYTAIMADGGWKPAGADKVMAERVVIYEIAMERGDVLKLRDIARRIGKLAKQEAVMIVTPCGDVDFVKQEMPSHEAFARQLSGLDRRPAAS